ncbi:MAG: M14 family zinc carboxypeptidase, partial [Bdellovibrionota bacterium]
MSFPELVFLENLLQSLGDTAKINQLGSVKAGSGSERFPLYSVCLGSKAPDAPTFALVGGVHGQEKIGTQVVLSYLETLSELMRWDEQTHDLLQKVRIAFYPIANPVGMFLLQRGNGNRVDLMRNAPGDHPGTTFLLGGQRLSPYLPWYRGKAGDPMEVEAQALCEFVRNDVLPARTAITLDCHSGYGSVDRLWFPYSHTREPFPQLAETYALKCLLDRTYPNHVYLMEPGSAAYRIQGDLWDFLYSENLAQKNPGQFLPLTLEMGSWNWVKKNPVQLFSAMG